MHRRIAPLIIFCLFCVTSARQAAAQGTPPVILFQPTNRVAAIGGAATFIVSASGSNLVYRWRREGIPLSNGTNRLLSLINLSNGNAGAYTVAVTNFFGSVTSQPAFLTLTGAAPRIYVQPTNTLVCPGGPDTLLRVLASGSPPFNYQWLRDGTLVSGQDSNTLSLPGDPVHVGDYTVIVSNGYGSETSQVARLSLGPIILQQPESQIAQAGSNVLFQVGVVACTGTRYQWRFNGVNIPDGTNAGLYYRSPDIQHEGNYDVVVSDNFRSLTSAVAHLTVLRYAPLIFNQPIDLIETLSTNILFAVTYGGAPLPTFQWYHDGVAIPGENDRLLRFMAYPWLQGDYWVVLSNSIGSVTSRIARFTLPQIEPIVITPPASLAYCPELTYEHPPFLFVDAVSLEAAPRYYQWFREGSAVPGATNATLFIADIPEPFGRYTVEVSNFAGIVSAGAAVVSYGVSIEVDPAFEQTVVAGSFAIFTADVTACGPYTLQWRKDGADLPGQTNSVLFIDRATLEDAGTYTLVATYQSTSNTRNLQLHVEPFDPVIYDGEPLDQTVNAGEYVFLNFQYEIGFPHADIQWHFNGRPIPGETNDTLWFLALSPAQQGRYSVTLSNVSTVVTSRQARVQIFFSPPLFDIEPEDQAAPLDGNPVSFYTYALGAPPPQYQWLFNGTPLRNQTNYSLEVEFRSTNQAGGYSVIANNLLGSVTSRVATLTAELYPPSFVVQPANQSVTAGENVYLYPYANGSPLPRFQWYHDGVPIPGANASGLSFTAGYLNQVGGYYVVASNFLGVATSAVAQVSIVVVPPRIVVQPFPQQLVAGEALSLSVTISNNVPARFQWHRDGSALPGETNQFFLKRTTATNDSGEYHVTAWNNGGMETSHIALVEVRLPASLDQWTWRRPVPQGNHLYDIAYGAGRHVAVGEKGALVISTNSTDWTDAHKPGHHQNRDSIIFGNGVFLAREYGDYLLQRSTNGIDWINTPYPGPVYPGFVFGNGRFVGGGSGSEQDVTVSTNGLDWETVTVSPSAVGLGEEFSDQWYFQPFAFVKDRFLANYEVVSPLSETGLLYSTNGLDWQRAEVMPSEIWGPARVASVAYGNGIYLGVFEGNPPELLRSTDGVHWARLPLAEPFLFTANTIAFGNGRFVAGGYQNFYAPNPTLMHSTNGVTWTPIEAAGTNSTYKVRFENDRFVAVGPYGRLLTSTNGVDWQGPNSGSDLNIRSMARADGQFVAVGNEGIVFTSENGRSWVKHSLGTNINLRSVARFNNRYIAVGERDDTLAAPRVSIYTSPDAIHWQPAPGVGNSGYGNLFSLACNTHTVVAVGDSGTVAFSHDGLHWDDALSMPTTRDLNAVIWNGAAFYAAGKDGTVLTSTNGANWLSIGPGGSRNLHGIAYGNGVFVTVANGGRYFVGHGIGSWQRYDWRSSEDLSDIIFDGGRFIAVGDNGIIHTSPDGTNWTRRVNPSGNDLRSVLYSEGSYWVVGNNETILQSVQVDPALRIHRVPGSSDLAFELLGEAGLNHRLQGSHGLNDWTDILTFIAGPDPERYRTDAPYATGWRFYRVISP